MDETNNNRMSTVAATEKLQKLVAERDQMETEIKELVDFLHAPGNPGLKGGLIDSEGFPIEDVEKIISVRTARNKLAMKQNDYKDLMAQVEAALFVLHALYKENDPESDEPIGQVNTHPTKEVVLPEGFDQPFAIVAGVKPTSPAAKSGLEESDLIFGFGSVNHQNNRKLQALPDVVHENSPVRVIVKRNQKIEFLSLTPQKWSGPGLLGCHLKPI